MTPSKLTDAVERGIKKMKSRPIGAIAAPDGDIVYEVSSTMLRTFARDLILAVKESVPEESKYNGIESGYMDIKTGGTYLNKAFGNGYAKGIEDCRAEILRSLDAFLGDNE